MRSKNVGFEDVIFSERGVYKSRRTGSGPELRDSMYIRDLQHLLLYIISAHAC